MKPLKLKLNAFGPYSGYEEVDFTKLDNIYLITGATGAGKTTIFDGISFALFGKTSGSDRDIKEIKSDFSDENEISYVELEFILHDKVYKIRREPDQNIKNSKGKISKRNYNASLYLPDGKILSKISEINNKVQEILGLNVEQFKQIVMLPQGEFKKLIESGMAEKEAIFRKIFSSKIYKDFQDNLKMKSIEARKELEKFLDRRELLIKKINPGQNEILGEKLKRENLNISEIIEATRHQILNDKARYEDLQIEKNALKNIIEDLTNKLQQSDEIEKKRKRLLAVELNYSGLLQKKDEYKNYELKLENSKKAKEIFNYEKAFIEAEDNLKRKEAELNKAKENLKLSEEDYKLKHDKLREKEALNREKEELKLKVVNLEELAKTFKEYEQKKKLYLKERDALKTLEETYKKKSHEKNVFEREIKDIDKLLESFEGLNIEILQINNNVEKKLEEINALSSFFKKINVLKDDIKAHKKLSVEYNLISEKYIEENRKYDLANETIKKQQAGILATLLKEGEPCIVCGSTHHPNKAKLSNNNLTEEKLKSIKENIESISEKKEKIFQNVVYINSKIEESLKGEVAEGFKKFLDIDDFSREDIEQLQNKIHKKGTSLNGEIKSIKRNKEEKVNQIKLLEGKKIIKNKILNSKEVIEKDLKELENNIKETYAKYNVLKEITSTLKERVKDIESLKSLEETIKTIGKTVEKIEATIEEIERLEQLARENLISFRRNLENKELECKEVLETKSQKNKDFMDSLLKVNFSKELYKESLINDIHIKELEESIKKYNEDILKYQEEIRMLKEDIKNKEKVDIESIEKEKNISINKLNMAEEEEKILYSRNSNNIDIMASIEEISENIGNKEENYKIISHISNIANGNNSKRITFERYVLTHHFNEILKAANIRFKSMTNDRYFLERKEDITDARKGQGLDFNVYDNYTGKTRSIKSLSGGEGFKASLSLALGLSDVIESNSGGVRIDAMFIDEGFGTLDPESLEKAIETILELSGEGKIIGIISHVPELRERILSKIEVKKAKNGSKLKVIEE